MLLSVQVKLELRLILSEHDQAIRHHSEDQPKQHLYAGCSVLVAERLVVGIDGSHLCGGFRPNSTTVTQYHMLPRVWTGKRQFIPIATKER